MEPPSQASVRAVQKELPQATYIEVDKAGSAVFVDNWEPFLEDVKAHVEAADLAPQLA